MTGPQEQAQRNADAGLELEPDLGRFVANLALAVDRGIARRMAHHDLMPLDVHLLIICQQLGECSATQLVQLLPVDAARISRLVNGLVERDLLIRRRPRNDRRVVLLSLSAEGEALTTEVTRHLRDFYAGLTRGLTEGELEAFFAVAQRLIANHEAMTGS